MVSVYVWFLWWPLDKAISNLNKINRVWEKYIKLKKFIDEPVDIIDGDKEYEFKV
jgi:hypothetical protein